MKIDFSKVDQSKSWPIEEAKTILKNFKDKTNKGYILFQTGYGPSGLPHIGTFAEVSRTQMVMKMLNKISDIPIVVGGIIPLEDKKKNVKFRSI